MNYIQTDIEGLWIIEPKVFADARGYFVETYKKEEFDAKIGRTDFIQDNESMSNLGVLRGLHYQEGDTAQAKLVRVVSGKVWDVAVDLRKNSPTFAQYVGVELSGENKRHLFIPRGFAHGFVVLSDTAIFSYKVDNAYSPSTERTLDCMDADLNIQWPLDSSKWVLSEKDRVGKSLKEVSLRA
jgi:dTDP-4-dehydrorhamnose 3,5-epimerase